MNPKRWLAQTAALTREHGLNGIKWGMRRPLRKTLRLADSVYDDGEYIFDYEWDVLVILDACRYDELACALDRRDLDLEVEAMRSRNSATRMWMQENFEGYSAEKANTYYITGNPWASEYISDDEWAGIDHVYQRAWREPGTVRPSDITEAAIYHWRDSAADRMIVHYMQPHEPYVTKPNVAPNKDVDHFGNQPSGNVWDRVELGEIGLEEVKKAYRSDLDFVLDDIFGKLLQNLEAETMAISADHGESFGEWGIFGHMRDLPIEPLRQVPWVETSSVDRKTIDPDLDIENTEDDTDSSVEEKLSALGYM